MLLPTRFKFNVPNSTIDNFLQDSIKRHLQEASMLLYLHERYLPSTKAAFSKVQENNSLMEKVVKVGGGSTKHYKG